MPYPVNTFPNFNALLNYINSYWITNGMEEITGVIGNDVVNALLTFVEQSPLNWQTALIVSSGGDINATRPVNVFITTPPNSLTWGDNIYNQYIFNNTTGGDIPTLMTYYDLSLQPLNVIPANSLVNICKATNGFWIVVAVPNKGSAAAYPALKGTVGGGGADDPVDGSTSFQSNKLMNLGSTTGGKLSIIYADTPMSSWGNNAGFTYDPNTGTISWLNGSTFSNGSALEVDRNQ